MRNYNTYLKGMEKGNDEKLFFQHILTSKYDRVIDFGCGKGDILKACGNLGHSLVGIDHDPIMIEYAKANVPNAKFYPSLKREMIIPNKTLIIFSSVLHEVEGYWKQLKEIIQGTGATLVIRDMRFSETVELVSKELMAQVIRKSHPQMLADFTARWGIMTDKDLYHWFLKYSYVDNWDLELRENYFSFDYADLLSMGNVVYERNYTLEFKRDRVLHDFGVELNKPTHTQLIIKLKETL